MGSLYAGLRSLLGPQAAITQPYQLPHGQGQWRAKVRLCPAPAPLVPWSYRFLEEAIRSQRGSGPLFLWTPVLGPRYDL